MYEYRATPGSGGDPTLPMPTGQAAWRLGDVRLHSTLNGASVARQTYDRFGGAVELDVSGDIDQLCPGGSERLRFTWRFDRDVGGLAPGDEIAATLTAESLSADRGCRGDVGAQSSVAMGGSDQPVPSFSETEARALDRSRFSSTGERVTADAGPSSRRAGDVRLLVSASAPEAEQRLAWFSVEIVTPAGSITYVYPYERVAER